VQGDSGFYPELDAPLGGTLFAARRQCGGNGIGYLRYAVRVWEFCCIWGYEK